MTGHPMGRFRAAPPVACAPSGPVACRVARGEPRTAIAGACPGRSPMSRLMIGDRGGMSRGPNRAVVLEHDEERPGVGLGILERSRWTVSSGPRASSEEAPGARHVDRIAGIPTGRAGPRPPIGIVRSPRGRGAGVRWSRSTSTRRARRPPAAESGPRRRICRADARQSETIWTRETLCSIHVPDTGTGEAGKSGGRPQGGNASTSTGGGRSRRLSDAPKLPGTLPTERMNRLPGIRRFDQAGY